MKYVCDICGYVYDPAAGDPDNGVAPGTPWEAVPEDWVCPRCGVGQDQFSPKAERENEQRKPGGRLPLFCFCTGGYVSHWEIDNFRRKCYTMLVT